MRVSPILTAFNAGEISPQLRGRTDLEKYAMGCETVENFICRSHGGLQRRPGNYFIGEVKTSSKATRIIPFCFSTTQAYVIEMGDEYMRFYMDYAQIELSGAAYEIVSPYAEADLWDVQYIQDADIMYLVHRDYPVYKLSRTGNTAWTLEAVEFVDGPYLDVDDSGINLKPSATTGSITLVAEGVSHSATFDVDNGSGKGTITAGSGTPYSNLNAGDTIIVTGTADNNGTYTIDSVTDTVITCTGVIAGADGVEATTKIAIPTFEAGHVGAFFRLYIGTTWGHVKITYVTDSTNATADVLETLGGTSACDTWREGAWSTKNGFPSVVAFFEQRLVLAASTEEPQTIWASVSGDYENFTPGTLDDDPFTYTISAQQVNAIRWMGTMNNLIFGTTSGEARLGQQSQADPVTPSNAKITFQSFFGSALVPGLSVGSAVLFWERAGHPDNLGERLRELSYNWETDAYAGVDLTLLSEHIMKGGCSEMALQQYPFRILWCVRNDGVLVGLTYERDQDVVGWHRHPMDNGTVESVCCIPGDDQDDLYMVVNRTVGGATKRYIEVMENYDWGDDQADCFFVDCGLTYDGTEKTISGATAANPVVITATSHGFSNGNHIKLSGIVGMTELNGMEVTVANAAANTFECSGVNGLAFTAYVSGGIAKKMSASLSGMDHLEGETVDVLTDGAVHPAVTVASGVVALEWYASVVHVGLHYDSKMTTMPLEGGSQEGTTQGKQARIHEVALRFYQTLGGKVGSDDDNLDTIGFRTSRDTYGNPPALYTGDKEVMFPGDWDSEAQITVVQDQPLPMTLLALMPRYRTEDR